MEAVRPDWYGKKPCRAPLTDEFIHAAIMSGSLVPPPGEDRVGEAWASVSVILFILACIGATAWWWVLP